MTVHVIGNATVDIAYRVTALPRVGETLLATERSVQAGGKGLNQAIVAARAGAAVCLTASVGTDAASAVLRDAVAGEPALSAAWIKRDLPSDESIIVVDDDGANLILSTDSCAASLDPPALSDAIALMVPGDTLLVQGNLSVETTGWCLAQARERGCRTVLNPAPFRRGIKRYVSLTDVLVVNEVEATDLVGDATAAEQVSKLKALGPRIVALTRGAKGCLIATESGLQTFEAPAVKSVDTAGAGDVFTGVFAAGLAHGAVVEAAALRAVLAASSSVTRFGTSAAFPSSAELAKIQGCS